MTARQDIAKIIRYQLKNSGDSYLVELSNLLTDEQLTLMRDLIVGSRKPEPELIGIDWASAPDIAGWAAMDEDGKWWWYENQPFVLGDSWACEGEFPKKFFAKPFDGYWKASLQRRPEEVT